MWLSTSQLHWLFQGCFYPAKYWANFQDLGWKRSVWFWICHWTASSAKWVVLSRDQFIILPPVGERSIVMSMSLCVCLCVCLSMIISLELHARASSNFLCSCTLPMLSRYPFSALTLLVGWQVGHLACKNWVVGCWHGYLSGARCRLAYGPTDATATHCLLLQ